MNRKMWCAALLSLVVLIGAGCGQKPKTAAPPEDAPQIQAEQGNENKAPDDSSNESNTPEVDVTPVDQSTGKSEEPAAKDENKQKIDVYYTDPQEMELKKSEKEISFSNDIEKYIEAFKGLQTSGSSDLVPLWGKIEMKTMNIVDGTLTIDIHMPDEARLGAGGEQYALDALKNTMFQFDEVKFIELLVDGDKVESLMGHVDLDHPMKRDS